MGSIQPNLRRNHAAALVTDLSAVIYLYDLVTRHAPPTIDCDGHHSPA